MTIKINLSELSDVLSILSVWADDMQDIAPEEALRTRSLIFNLECQAYHKPTVSMEVIQSAH